jgi:mevalonate kinase
MRWTSRAGAPGKVILGGEHAAVYGKKAVAASVSLRTYAQAGFDDSGSVRLQVPVLGIDSLWGPKELVDRAEDASLNVSERVFLFVLRALGVSEEKFSGLRVFIETQLPTGAGLGSSASFCVALVTCLMHVFGMVSRDLDEKDREKINALAFKCESILHGTPSGIDNTVSTFGGAILFQRKTEGSSFVTGVMKPFAAWIVNTKVPRNTKKMVAGVAEKMKDDPELIHAAMNDIELVSQEMWNVLVEGQRQDGTIAEFICQRFVTLQRLLEVLGVGHASISRVVDLSAKFGFGAKLTGAGGGGCVLVSAAHRVSAEDKSRFESSIKELGFDLFTVDFGVPGVTLYDDSYFKSL